MCTLIFDSSRWHKSYRPNSALYENKMQNYKTAPSRVALQTIPVFAPKPKIKPRHESGSLLLYWTMTILPSGNHFLIMSLKINLWTDEYSLNLKTNILKVFGWNVLCVDKYLVAYAGGIPFRTRLTSRIVVII